MYSVWMSKAWSTINLGHLQPVIKAVKTFVLKIGTYYFQSDSPSTQYKNKDNYFLFKKFCEDFPINSATWNYTTLGHGQCSPDAVGGTVRGICDWADANEDNVTAAEDFVEIVKASEKVEIFMITKDDIKKFDFIDPQN